MTPELVILLISYRPPLASTILHLLVGISGENGEGCDPVGAVTRRGGSFVDKRSEIASEAGGMLEVWSAGIRNKSRRS